MRGRESAVSVAAQSGDQGTRLGDERGRVFGRLQMVWPRRQLCLPRVRLGQKAISPLARQLDARFAQVWPRPQAPERRVDRVTAGAATGEKSVARLVELGRLGERLHRRVALRAGDGAI